MNEQLTAQDLEILCMPFPSDDVNFLQGNAYITETEITIRIEAVDPAWSFVITDSGNRDKRAYATGQLTIKGSTRGNVGMGNVVYRKGAAGDPYQEANDAEKSAATDCLKRCARLFGVGRYLLELPDNVKDNSSYNRWMNGTGTQARPAPAQQTPQPTPNAEPVEDTVIRHVAKHNKDGKTYHVLTTTNHGNISIWSRKLFKEAAWVDDMDWLEIDKTTEYDGIPVLIKPNGNYWELVEVAECIPM